MPTFQDARDGLGALLKEGNRNLSPDDRDLAIVHAGRAFSRRFPRILAVEVDGNGGFEYALPTGWVEDFSTLTELIFPWDPNDQNPRRLEHKDHRIFDGPSGRKIRFVRDRPTATQKFLPIFTAPHTVDTASAIADTIGTLDVAGTVVNGSDITSSSTPVDVGAAKDVQLFVKVSAAAGTLLEVIIEVSADGIDFAPIGAMRDITGIGTFMEPLSKAKVSKFIRVKYTTTGGSFTLRTRVVQEASSGTFTIKDIHFDAFLYLAAAIASQSLADFYSNLIDSQLDGETTDYEGKATFWQTNHTTWNQKWKDEAEKIGPIKGATAFAQFEWDLKGTTQFELLTHGERDR